MLVARDLEVRAGARLLLEHASFQVGPGDKIGLVGRNGAGKTTLTRILSGEAQPAAGLISRTGTVGYLPQDPRTGDLDLLAKNRILSARGLDAVVDRLRRAELGMGDDSEAVRDKAMAAYARAEAELAAAGGYAAEAEAARIASNLGLPERVLHQPLRHPFRRAAAAGRARAHPLLRCRDAAARRADEPPRRRLDRLAPELPSGPSGRSAGDQPRRRPARQVREQGVPSRCEHRRARRLRAGLEALPAAARDRREAAPARTVERRAQGRSADGPGGSDAGQGHQGGRGAEHGQAGRAAAGGAGSRNGEWTGSPRSDSPSLRPAAGLR